MKKMLYLLLIVLMVQVFGCKQQPQQPPANEQGQAVEQVQSEEAPAK